MNLDDALQTFVIESRELLESMEDALLRVEQSPDDADLINAIFRAAHTIKGSAGLFGLDHVVHFTHHAENVLDRVRAGERAIDGPLVAIFLEVCDHMGALIDLVAEGKDIPPDVQDRSEALIGRLKEVSGAGAVGGEVPGGETAGAQKAATGIPATREEPVEREGGPQEDSAQTQNWHISLRFGKDLLRNGMDPVAFIRYLTTFGEIASIVTLLDDIPKAAAMDPEDCYLGFEINYRTEADKKTIEGAFEFVRDDARISILPPHSKIAEYIDFIRKMPEEELHLGEILVRCGTLTENELDTALKDQEAERTHGETPHPIGEVLVAQHVVSPPVVEAALQKQKQVRDNKSGDSGMIRVNADKLDEHINLIGELIIASAGINLSALKTGIPELLEAASVMKRLVENLRDSALQLRMVQIGATFNKFQRVVRDVSREIGKDIRLEISGAETELDKTVVEKIGDPLTHLVRNSMDHGIESAELRLARGKPPYGTLRLNAYHDSGSIAIEVSDDGGGLDKERILAKAVEKGLVKPDQALSDDEIFKLIFEPGFSTAEKVNNLSGRGVGMDVVRRNIAALRGTIDIDSREGLGTTIRIRLPLTLAIIDGFLVGVGQSAFVIPLDSVVECIEHRNLGGQRNFLNLRGEALPFIGLRELFGIEGEAPERGSIVVVQSGGQRAGIVVDQLMGEFQTVIKPLGRLFANLRGIGGSTILGTGDVALILDIASLVGAVTRAEEERLSPLQQSPLFSAFAVHS